MSLGYGIEVEGLKEFEQGLKELEPKLLRATQRGMREAAEPMKQTAGLLELSAIRNGTIPWSQFRIGSTLDSVYIVPKLRGVRGGDLKNRPNFGVLLMERAVKPAFLVNEGLLEARVEETLGIAIRESGL